MHFVLDDTWSKIESVAVYGYGRTAKGSIDKFIKEFKVVCIIDNNPVYTNRSYRGISIKSFEEYRREEGWNETKIVMLVAGKARQSIIKDLEKVGLHNGTHFTDLDTFSTEWYYRFKGKFNISKIGESITNRCTFKCRGCNMLMPYYSRPVDYPLDMLKRDAGLLFSIVDEVSCFSIIGGEPLLHPELTDYLQFLGREYSVRIGNIQLISNGSIMPTDRLINACVNFNVEVRLSDYTKAIPYKEKYINVRDAYKRAGVRLAEFKQDVWIDFGFPERQICTGETAVEIRNHMLNCHGMCHWLHNNKMYFCSNAWSAQEIGKVELVEEQDYICLDKIIHTDDKGRDLLYSFYLGNMKNGYMTHCKRCNGFACSETIPAGIQIGR